jgi:hypothetical protein
VTAFNIVCCFELKDREKPTKESAAAFPCCIMEAEDHEECLRFLAQFLLVIQQTFYARQSIRVCCLSFLRT